MTRLPTLACDACRQRKVKCDAQQPSCGSCRSSAIPCKYVLPRRKRGPKPREHSSYASEASPAPAPAPTAGAPASPAATGTGTSVASHSPQAPSGESMDGMSPSTSEHAPAAPLPRLPSLRSSPFFTQLPSLHGHGSYHSWNPAGSSPEDAPRPEGHLPSPSEIQRTLIAAVESKGISLEHIARRCVDEAMSSLFVIIPVFHQPSLLAAIPLLSQPILGPQSCVSGTGASPGHSHGHGHTPSAVGMQRTPPARPEMLEEMRAFVLITSLCASLCGSNPTALGVGDHGIPLTQAFLRAGRSMLALFEDLDLEQPSSTSVICRLLISASLLCLGKTNVAMYYLGSTHHIIMLMRLFDERTLQNMPPLEALQLRNIFWTLFSSDKSASILNNVPSVLQEISMDQPITILHKGCDDPPLLDGSSAAFAPPYEAQVLAGFHLTNRLWFTGSDILLDLRIVARIYAKVALTSSAAAAAGAAEDPLDIPCSAIMNSYMEFCSILDALPLWLRDPDSHTVAGDEASTAFQRRSFWVQKVNLVVTFHCLRLIILRKAADLGFCHLLGLTNDDAMLAHRKTEIAHDLIAATRGMPFEAMQTNSEPCVEKLRQVGVSLLEIMHKSPNQAITARAKSIFADLIDVIARMDSKVSEALHMDSMGSFG